MPLFSRLCSRSALPHPTPNRSEATRRQPSTLPSAKASKPRNNSSEAQRRHSTHRWRRDKQQERGRRTGLQTATRLIKPLDRSSSIDSIHARCNTPARAPMDASHGGHQFALSSDAKKIESCWGGMHMVEAERKASASAAGVARASDAREREVKNERGAREERRERRVAAAAKATNRATNCANPFRALTRLEHT